MIEQIRNVRMEQVAVFQEKIPLTPKDLRNDITSIDTILEEKLRVKMENRCSPHGFVLPGTIKILSRAMGYLERGRFTGNILFDVQAEGKILNPPDGFVLEGEVIRKNKMGMYVNYQDAIHVIIPRDIHIGDETFEAIQIGETVKVEIKKSRFQVKDAYILSVGLFRGKVAKKRQNNAVAVATPDAETPDTDAIDAEALEGEALEGEALEGEALEGEAEGEALEEEAEEEGEEEAEAEAEEEAASDAGEFADAPPA
jgi:DNA-directed RNA polymerase subunit E'/Rpb7